MRSASAWQRWRCSCSSPARLARTGPPGNPWRSGSRSRALPARRTTTVARTARIRTCVHSLHTPRAGVEGTAVVREPHLFGHADNHSPLPLLTSPHLADWGGVGFHRHCGSGRLRRCHHRAGTLGGAYRATPECLDCLPRFFAAARFFCCWVCATGGGRPRAGRLALPHSPARGTDLGALHS